MAKALAPRKAKDTDAATIRQFRALASAHASLFRAHQAVEQRVTMLAALVVQHERRTIASRWRRGRLAVSNAVTRFMARARGEEYVVLDDGPLNGRHVLASRLIPDGRANSVRVGTRDISYYIATQSAQSPRRFVFSESPLPFTPSIVEQVDTPAESTA